MNFLTKLKLYIIKNIENTERTNSDFETALKDAEEREINQQKRLNAENKRVEQERKENQKWLEEKMAKYNIKPSGDSKVDNINVALKELEEVL